MCVSLEVESDIMVKDMMLILLFSPCRCARRHKARLLGPVRVTDSPGNYFLKAQGVRAGAGGEQTLAGGSPPGRGLPATEEKSELPLGRRESGILTLRSHLDGCWAALGG